MGIIARVATMVGLSTTSAHAADKGIWPDLPKTGYISGRVATIEDAKRGDAAFSMDGQGKGALRIKIPQYALWKDDQGVSHPVILIQAERAPDNSEIVGLRYFDGKEAVATMPELTLLGTKKPN